jgi:Phage tail protein.
MLTKVEVSTTQGQTLVLPLEYTDNGYLIQEIEGLDPVKAVIASASFANQDGEQFQSSRREARNIIIKLGLEKGAAGSVRDLRTRLYAIFMPKATVRLRFFSDDEPEVEIYAKVESCFAPLFVQEPIATISLLCHQPDFYIPTPVVISGETVSGITEFQVNYEGSVETGIKLTLLLTRDLNSFTIYHRSSDNSLNTLEFKEPVLLGDMLVISTISGDKGATLTRAGSIKSVLYGITPVSNWINLFPGTNHIRVHADGAAIPFSIDYTTKLGGL